MEIIIWIIVGIIYAIAEANNRTGRMSSSRFRNGYGRYGVYGMQDDFSLEYDPLADIRQTYNERLQVYYKYNKPKTYLINKNCEARFIKEDNGNMWFYVKSRTTGSFSGAYFEVKGNNTHVSTMWAMIDMEFNSSTRYNDITELYYKLNQGFETIGGLKYFYQPITGGLPKPVTNKLAQNEFCRMEIKTLSNGEKIIICSEIWGDLAFDKPRKFTIKGDKLVLYGILADFAKNKNKMLNYLDLLCEYVKRTDCMVEEIPVEPGSKEKIKPASEILKESETKKEPEPIKYIHVDFDEKQEKEENKPAIDAKQEEIEKYNERNLDL